MICSRPAGWSASLAPAPTSPDRPRTALLLGLVIPDLGTTEIFEPICQGIANAPDAAGHALLWPQGSGNTLELCRQCIERNVSGVFFAPVEHDAAGVNRKVIGELKAAQIPVVLLDRRADTTERCDLVSLDNHRAGRLATEYLVNLGARRIAFLAYRGQGILGNRENRRLPARS